MFPDFTFAVFNLQEIFCIVRKYQLNRSGTAIRKRVFECTSRQARIVFISRNKRAPSGELNLYRNFAISKVNRCKRKSCFKNGLLKMR